MFLFKNLSRMNWKRSMQILHGGDKANTKVYQLDLITWTGEVWFAESLSYGTINKSLKHQEWL